jgi:ParB family chromosome partitioning protein
VAPKRGLGKGLDALLPPEPSAEREARGSPPDGEDGNGREDADSPAFPGKKPAPAGGELKIPLDRLKTNPDQPRKNFGEAELQELADSIREHGIVEPIIVEKDGDEAYTIVAGERRFRAAGLAGLAEVPVIVRSYSADERMEITLIENVQRVDLNPVEEAAAYRNLMEVTGLSQDEMAVKVGKNRSTVANALRLLKLPEEIRQSLEKGEISPGHARALLSTSGDEAMNTLFREVLEKGLSVREAEKRAATLNGKEKGPGSEGTDPDAKRPPELRDIEEKLIEKFGTKVVITGDLAKGSIRIDYYSMEDLDRLYELILKN